MSEAKILILAHEKIDLGELKLILEFLGEELAVVEWHKFTAECFSEVQPSTMILSLAESDDVEGKVNQISQVSGDCPIILFGNSAEKIDYPAKLKPKILGQFDVPFKYTQVLDTLHRCQVYREHQRRGEDVSSRPIELFRSLVGTSRSIQAVREAIEQVAKSEVNVLILGESGTGKEVAARNIHYHSKRGEKPFIPVNCGAIPSELLESELFGHEKGAFTGALAARAGRFELAQGGTLFLDEIGDMPPSMQVKLLRVLQERTFERVGSSKTLNADVRIIAATHRNLEDEIEKGNFREDLYYRLNVFPVEMPALRNRTEDIPYLLNDLISRLESEKKGSIRFSPPAIMAMCQYKWPGNIRELANLIERLVVLHPHGVIDVSDLPQKFRQDYHVVSDNELLNFEVLPQEPTTDIKPAVSQLPVEGIDLKEHLSQLEFNLIQQALERTNGVVARAAEHLNMRRTTLVEKMKKYGLQRSDSVSKL